MGPCIVNQIESLSNKMRLYSVYYISVDTKQAKELYQFKNIKRKLYRTNGAIRYNKIYCKKSCLQICYKLNTVAYCWRAVYRYVIS